MIMTGNRKRTMVGRISGTGSYIPKEVWDNQVLTQLVDTSDEWIQERTGVARRHIAGKNETTAYMAAEAAKRALEDADVSAQDIDLILVATISPGRIMPSTSCEVQAMIGAKRATCFDLNAACTGFLFALNTAQAYIKQGIYSKVLVIGTESLSNLVNWKDRGTCILFGDGAGAVVLEASEEGRYAQYTQSIGCDGEVLTVDCRNQKQYESQPCAEETFIQMDGREVFKFAVSKVPEAIGELLKQEEKNVEDISQFILHQANRRIVQSVSKRMKVDIKYFPTNMEEYGNTSSASIPILLDELNRSGRLKRGTYLVLAGFGAGLSYGASLIQW